MIVCGLMTGTSADAVDVALVNFEQDSAASQCSEQRTLSMEVLAHREAPFDPELQREIRLLTGGAAAVPSTISSVDARLGQCAAEAAAGICAEAGEDCDLAVLHGQTVWHDVVDGQVNATLQLGQPAWIAQRLGVPVLSDVRARDVAAGGQGAPLAGVLDQLLLAGTSTPTAMLNLGGIANVTVMAPGRPVQVFDTGPANALIDSMVARLTEGAQNYDHDGRLAAAGTVLPDLLDRLLADPYYERRAPKSTGKEHFNAAYLDAVLGEHPEFTGPDLVATVTRLTARTVAQACRRQAVTAVIASGGGTRNPTLMGWLQAELGDSVRLSTTDEAFGLPEGAKEACLMALIGWFTWHGLPAVTPDMTGARHSTLAGRLSPGAGPLRLPRPLDHAPDRLRVIR